MLFPNPARGWLTVARPAAAPATEADVVNDLGQVMLRIPLATPVAQVNLAGLGPGFYSLRFLLGGRPVVQRFVVE